MGQRRSRPPAPRAGLVLLLVLAVALVAATFASGATSPQQVPVTVTFTATTTTAATTSSTPQTSLAATPSDTPTTPAVRPTNLPGESGPVIATDLPCYLADRSVTLSGTIFPPGTTYSVAEDGTTLGTGTVAPAGTITGSLSSGSLARGATHLHHAITVTAPGASASTEFDVTQFSAGFSPTAGNPATLLVRFAIYGFGIGPAQPDDPAGDPVPQQVFLHYVDPHGKTGETIDLGRTHGRCGSLPTTRVHHLFPFRPGSGTWHLQFDLDPTFSRSSSPRVVRAVVVR
jgi:hypothetical protein